MKTHIYIGPTTKWGLIRGTPCRIIGGATGGGKRIRTEGKQWIVGAKEVRKMTEEEKKKHGA